MNTIIHRARKRITLQGMGIVAVGLALLLLPAAGKSQASSKASAFFSTGKIPYAHRRLANATFVAFDTETTGLSPHGDRIVEIAAVKYRNGKILDQRSWLINPQRKIPYYARKVHGISDAMVKNKPTFKEIYPEFAQFIDGTVLVAHNARFDINFVNAELERAGLKPPRNQVIDSLRLFRHWYPKLKSHSLQSVAHYTHVHGDKFHRALADSAYVALIMNKRMKKWSPDARLRDLYADAGGTLSF